jgi:hypothetical protein
MSEKEARFKLGYKDNGVVGGKQQYMDNRDDRQKVQGFNDLATEVERKGGNWSGQGPNLEPKFDALIQETRETNRLLGLQAQKNANAAPGPGPVPPPMPVKAAAALKRPKRKWAVSITNAPCEKLDETVNKAALMAREEIAELDVEGLRLFIINLLL